MHQFTRYILVADSTPFSAMGFRLLNWSFQGSDPSAICTRGARKCHRDNSGIPCLQMDRFSNARKLLKEWTRCFGVYGSGMLFGLVALPITVTILRKTLHRPEEALISQRQC